MNGYPDVRVRTTSNLSPKVFGLSHTCVSTAHTSATTEYSLVDICIYLLYVLKCLQFPILPQERATNPHACLACLTGPMG